MKMTAQHYQHLKDAIATVLRNNPDAVQRYESGNFPRSAGTKNLQMRFNNDILRSAVSSSWVCDNLYNYLNDTHINTALRALCPTVRKQYI